MDEWNCPYGGIAFELPLRGRGAPLHLHVSLCNALAWASPEEALLFLDVYIELLRAEASAGNHLSKSEGEVK